MERFDLGPATKEMARLVAGIGDDQLAAPTPCPEYCVADLAEHVGGLTLAFTAAARKTATGEQPSVDGSQLEPGWRDRVAADLADLAAAWDDASAWEGMTMAGPVEVPGPVAALIALDELVVHAWDLAVATGQDYDPAESDVERCHGFAASFEPPAENDGGLFGPPVAVPDDASPLDRLVGLTGRDPSWSA